MSNITDLTTQAPRSPRTRLGDFVILGRTLDKGRADINGAVGEYHYNCPLDNFLFGFKGVDGADVRKLLADGASDDDVVAWLGENGTAKTAAEIAGWSAGVEGYRPYDDAEKKEWFVGECAKLGIEPATSTLFDMLEADDKASF